MASGIDLALSMRRRILLRAVPFHKFTSSESEANVATTLGAGIEELVSLGPYS